MVLTFSHLFYFFHFYPIRSSTIPRYIKVQLNQISMPLPFTVFWSHTHTHTFSNCGICLLLSPNIPLSNLLVLFIKRKSNVASISSSSIRREGGADVHEPNLTGFNKAALQKELQVSSGHKCVITSLHLNVNLNLRISNVQSGRSQASYFNVP